MIDAYEKFEINCDIAISIGDEKMVIYLWDGRTSDYNFQSNLIGYFHLYKMAQRYGLSNVYTSSHFTPFANQDV